MRLWEALHASDYDTAVCDLVHVEITIENDGNQYHVKFNPPGMPVNRSESFDTTADLAQFLRSEGIDMVDGWHPVGENGEIEGE